MIGLNALNDRVVRASMRREKQLVVDGADATRTLVIRGFARLIIGIAAMFAIQGLPDPWAIIPWSVVGALLGLSSLTSYSRALSYRGGWIDGRLAMAQSFAETGSLVHSYDYDLVHVLGINYNEIPDTPEGLE